MNRTLYTLFFYLSLPVILLRLWWRGQKAPAYRERWLERLGFMQPSEKGSQQPLWIHAVSVGETLAIVPLVKLIQARHPELPIVMTTMTPTGAERVKASFGDLVTHYYCPYDLPDALDRFLNKVNPRGCVIVETELWPNLVNACHSRKVPVLVANARLSERSAKGYARFANLSRSMLQQINLIAAQNATDGQRFLDLGLPCDALNVTGSIKFDVSAPEGAERLAYALRELWGTQRNVLIAASTHEGEEAQLLEAFQVLREAHPELLLVIVPRHPERFDHVAELIKGKGWNLSRRSKGDQPSGKTDVYLGDTMGELMKLIAAADIAFVGGSLIERGGHNPLEPAVLKKPVVMGPHYFNFLQICDALSEAGGLSVAHNQKELEAEFARLLSNHEEALSQGEKGLLFVESNQGALEKLYTLISKTCL
ncbi:lipid IV(A) 3-deoxy-D-manno-octulosonic acid transferase [Neptuniibacter caesariensis]|uniref:3-deoxy-D-manno-octulosonic acid transferase n=1 Tax=Neptuniibacter caesariensis TaxID=207954 RepID=A0A7U8GTV9_NEPCE|nr:lipid IV(A) 3-deoxy-D-manno-octulosonic acid transferase [Neptuniibacter caesariensis]EAR62861.1 3-deoxy-D-manno-octulosonic-acid transferase [Oceanospirillum sp. MED92] [Neptuniibacter caesariensis]